MSVVHIIGGGSGRQRGGVAGASRGVRVALHEMRPVRPTLVHKTDGLAELVCSNSFRGDKLDNAVGLLKEEMRRLGSVVMRAAERRACRRAPRSPSIASVSPRIVTELVTLASADHARARGGRGDPRPRPRRAGDRRDRAADLRRAVGRHRRVRRRRALYFYDAISPIVLAESLDRTKVFRASRWDRSFRSSGGQADGRTSGAVDARAARRPACGVDDGQGDYLNCPLSKRRVRALLRRARRTPSRRRCTTSTRSGSSKAACRSR